MLNKQLLFHSGLAQKRIKMGFIIGHNMGRDSEKPAAHA